MEPRRRRVDLRCRCGRVLDEFRTVLEDRAPSGAWDFVADGRTQPNARSHNDRELERIFNQRPSRGHVDKAFMRALGDPDDLDDDTPVVERSIVRYGCRCGAWWHLWVRDLAGACDGAARAGRRRVHAHELPSAKMAAEAVVAGEVGEVRRDLAGIRARLEAFKAEVRNARGLT